MNECQRLHICYMLIVCSTQYICSSRSNLMQFWISKISKNIDIRLSCGQNPAFLHFVFSFIFSRSTSIVKFVWELEDTQKILSCNISLKINPNFIFPTVFYNILWLKKEEKSSIQILINAECNTRVRLRNSTLSLAILEEGRFFRSRNQKSLDHSATSIALSMRSRPASNLNSFPRLGQEFLEDRIFWGEFSLRRREWTRGIPPRKFSFHPNPPIRERRQRASFATYT